MAIVRYLELALGPEIEEFVGTFVDYILVVYTFLRNILRHLHTVFTKLVLQKSKRNFVKSEARSLGHINAEGIGTEP